MRFGLPQTEISRQEAIYELIDSEGAYVLDLGVILAHHLASFRESPAVTEAQVAQLFSNVEEIHQVNKVREEFAGAWRPPRPGSDARRASSLEAVSNRPCTKSWCSGATPPLSWRTLATFLSNTYAVSWSWVCAGTMRQAYAILAPRRLPRLPVHSLRP